ncbi:MAG: hypothetical protein UX49_C0050G0006 [Candidatus Wolfebacteria bacterium GW2011_GWC2_46_275]|uniref:Uncharacterized protein n=2 Tax=Candidatus Wolfeibacteriota TaxID=1752735 RepID=A0A0G1U8F6_9BACT|nr:MAG: hypothetical protein UX70_C0001G0233 [Candidatus Wolfebacteria bacterium GW2011_GWB1_47_1]KKU34289.1 MAG: hypothetical protein UX49_C0050G0006 [Candidatus Wolfebacteria bacterium GW2011_GWC2_46_275]KKU42033.1 MAG: hypothetical protein UX58_C0004G0092 [Candidatus Wolfebacteria bacterium GW2011_GWB2_46_69]KKU54430.1 MAG: hypothetical protein UX76_C0002G0023 [Candidatus Wolfebacteria bacterium GW2011_GWC1_47_103]KKU59758.1 MAG: hypothetical protein UX83_C0002G0045 [Candidatus Wolfebacteria
MKKLFFPTFLSLTLALFVSAPVVFAQSGLVKCDESNPASCTLCTLFSTIKAVYDFAVQLTIILAVAYIIFGGYQMLISGANPTLYKKGQNHITQALLGLAIVLSAWFLVDMFMRALTGSGDIYGTPWRTLQCQ